MTFDMIEDFLRELAFLALVSAATAIVLSVLVKDRWRALLLASGLSTLVISLWELLSFGSFDIPFLIQAVVISTAVAMPIISIVDAVRGRQAGPA